jgi:hypothetical protein
MSTATHATVLRVAAAGLGRDAPATDAAVCSNRNAEDAYSVELSIVLLSTHCLSPKMRNRGTGTQADFSAALNALSAAQALSAEQRACEAELVSVALAELLLPPVAAPVAPAAPAAAAAPAAGKSAAAAAAPAPALPLAAFELIEKTVTPRNFLLGDAATCVDWAVYAAVHAVLVAVRPPLVSLNVICCSSIYLSNE